MDFDVESEEPSPQEEEKQEEKPEGDEKEEDDLFPSPEVPQQQAGEGEEGAEGDEEPSKPAQLIVETEKEPPTEVEPDTSSAPTLEIHAADESEDVVVQTKPVAPPPAKTLDLFDEEEQPKKEKQQVITWSTTSKFNRRLTCCRTFLRSQGSKYPDLLVEGAGQCMWGAAGNNVTINILHGFKAASLLIRETMPC